MEEKIIEKPFVNPPYLKALQEYGQLEFQVQRILTAFCAPFCQSCASCCCKEKYCAESRESAWLKLIWRNHGFTISNYHGETGWLTESGCKLSLGRPPVCYDFLCNHFLNHFSQNPDSLTALKKIAHLIAFSGKNALGNQSLITLTYHEISTKLNYNRLRDRIAKSLEMLDDYETGLDKKLYFNGGDYAGGSK